MALAITRTAVQYGDKLARDAEEARRELGHLVGPIPRYLYDTLEDDELAKQIVQRWTAKRLEMSQRIVMDQRLLRYMDPEKVQDHWSNFWTGAPLKKLQHSTSLTVGVFNYPRAIVESLTGLLTGSDDGLAYNCDVIPRDSLNEISRMRAQLVDTFVNGYWIPETEYERTFMRAGSNIYALGRNWKGVITQTEPGPFKNMPKAENSAPGMIASFWHGNHETLECVIVASELLPGVAAAMYPGNDDKIARALHSPSSWLKNFGIAQPIGTWDNSSTVTVLTCWFRSSGSTIGQAVVLMDSPMNAITNGRTSSVLLKKERNSRYPDIPWRCTPRFRTNDRPPDESQGALYDIAPIATMYDEVVSAARDMLWRAIYQRYKLTNAYGRPPSLIPNTSIISLRAGQDLSRLDDVINNVPVDTFIARLEEMMIILPGLSRYFLGQAPPSETSGEAITAAINASIQRQVSTRTEVRVDERWQYRQVVGQAREFASWEVNGKTVSMAPMLGNPGEYDFMINWDADNPKDATKAKQLALAALRAGVISLDTAQKPWGITNTEEEQRKIKAGFADVTLRPDIVALTEQALQARANRKRLEASVGAPPPPPPVKISLSGPIDPVTAQRMALAADPAAAAPPAGETAPQNGGQAANASATVAANMRPPAFENENDRGLPPSQAGDVGQP